MRSRNTSKVRSKPGRPESARRRRFRCPPSASLSYSLSSASLSRTSPSFRVSLRASAASSASLSFFTLSSASLSTAYALYRFTPPLQLHGRHKNGRHKTPSAENQILAQKKPRTPSTLAPTPSPLSSTLQAAVRGRNTSKVRSKPGRPESARRRRFRCPGSSLSTQLSSASLSSAAPSFRVHDRRPFRCPGSSLFTSLSSASLSSASLFLTLRPPASTSTGPAECYTKMLPVSPNTVP